MMQPLHDQSTQTIAVPYTAATRPSLLNTTSRPQHRTVQMLTQNIQGVRYKSALARNASRSADKPLFRRVITQVKESEGETSQQMEKEQRTRADIASSTSKSAMKQSERLKHQRGKGGTKPHSHVVVRGRSGIDHPFEPAMSDAAEMQATSTSSTNEALEIRRVQSQRPVTPESEERRERNRAMRHKFRDLAREKAAGKKSKQEQKSQKSRGLSIRKVATSQTAVVDAAALISQAKTSAKLLARLTEHLRLTTGLNPRSLPALRNWLTTTKPYRAVRIAGDPTADRRRVRTVLSRTGKANRFDTHNIIRKHIVSPRWRRRVRMSLRKHISGPPVDVRRVATRRVRDVLSGRTVRWQRWMAGVRRYVAVGSGREERRGGRRVGSEEAPGGKEDLLSDVRSWLGA